jgi:NADH:ubiquinone oxidoreductase subunit E
MKPEHVLGIVRNHQKEVGEVLSILEDIQEQYGYLPAEALRIVANETCHSLVDLYGVVTFYKFFSLEPKGKHLISVCLGTACHVRNGNEIAQEFERQLGIRAGETTVEKDITLETVNCLGACALGPIVVVDGHYFSNVKPQKVEDIIHRARAGIDRVDVRTDERLFPLEVSCPRCNHSLMDRNNYIDGYPSIRVTVASGGSHGWLRLSCLYGSYSVDHEYKILMDTVVNFFCPHCHTELIGVSRCPDCTAPMVPMVVRGGGMIQICSRRGCKGHILDLTHVSF